MIQVGRAIEGVSINGKEWLLDDNNDIMKFESQEMALRFLKENGFDKLTDEELKDSFFYEEIED